MTDPDIHAPSGTRGAATADPGSPDRVPPEEPDPVSSEEPDPVSSDEKPDVSSAERDRIVASAWKVLSRSGFAGFKVQLVVRDAHLSARVFYRHFASKDQLLLTLLADEMRRSGVLLSEEVAAAPDPVAKVVAWITAVLRIAGNPKLAPRARLFGEQRAMMHRFPAEVATAARHLLDPLEAAITRGRDEGTFPRADPEHDAQMVYLLTGAVQSRTLGLDAATHLDEVITTTVDFVLRALSPQVEPTRGGRAPRTPPG